jgi:uncharacterized protein
MNGLPNPLAILLEGAAHKASEQADPAHDYSHVLRVRDTALRIAAEERVDAEIVEAAALLHELFYVPKGSVEAHRSGELCAQKARALLNGVGFPSERIEAVCECIRVHAFSAGLEAATQEARVLQDADRLDAIGAIGVARCFATCATMKRPFYSPGDPFCRSREPDDKKWGVDHFYRKLLRIEQGLHTETARAMAKERTAFMRAFLGQLEKEIDTEPRA